MLTFQLGNIWTKVSFPIDEINNVGAVLGKHLTVDVPGAKYLWSYKSGEWDGRARLFKLGDDLASFTFLTGLFPEVLNALVKEKYTWTFEDQRGFGSTIPQLQQYTAPLRPYQHEVLTAAFGNTVGGAGWFPRGILHMATGSGKTEVAVAMYQAYPVQTVFLVHRKDLLLQAEERFKKYGITAGVIGAGRADYSSDLNIMTMQTLISRVKRKDANILPVVTRAEQIFIDEVHIMASKLDKGNQFVEIVNLFTNAHARWGLTATPFMRSQYDNMLLQGVTGDILATVKSDWLIQNGYLTPPRVTMIRVPGKLPMVASKGRSNKAHAERWRKIQSKGIINNSWRNKQIAAEVVKGPYPLLVLVKTIEQAKEIQREFTFDFEVPLLTGQNTAQERRQAVKDLQNGTINAIIASTIFDEGIDIPALRKIILASGGKSQVKMLQRVGRGVRLAANKHEVEIVDFGDQHNPTLRKHALERMRIWRAEGFEVNEI